MSTIDLEKPITNIDLHTPALTPLDVHRALKDLVKWAQAANQKMVQQSQEITWLRREIEELNRKLERGQPGSTGKSGF